jgi:hypothetical protein
MIGEPFAAGAVVAEPLVAAEPLVVAEPVVVAVADDFLLLEQAEATKTIEAVTAIRTHRLDLPLMPASRPLRPSPFIVLPPKVWMVPPTMYRR